MPLTLNAGTACPSEGVQPREEGARLPQHARTAAGDIIELTGAHSQSLHTVEHGNPPALSKKITTSPQSCLRPALLPTAHVTRRGSDNNKLQQQQLARSASLPALISRCHSLSLSLSLSLCRPFLPMLEFPSFSLSWNADLVPAWLC